MSKYYKITLKPVGSFFFGGESTFGGQDGTQQNYFARSNYFPQQTSLLGMLRYQLLAQNNGLPLHDLGEQKQKDLIGLNSFSAKSAQQNFGAIESLTPVCLQRDSELFVRQANDFSLYEPHLESSDERGPEKLHHIDVEFSNALECNWGNGAKAQPVLKNYDPKNGRPDLLVSEKGKEMCFFDWVDELKEYRTIDMEGFDKKIGNGPFISAPQIGIQKKADRKVNDKDEAFYKQVFFKLAEGWSFCFFAKLDLESKGFQLKDSLVTMGGEGSTFQMTIEKSEGENPYDDFINASTFRGFAPKRKNALILTSDALVTEDFSMHCDFAIAEFVPFRNIETQENAKSFSKMGTDINKPKRFLNLIKRGSVFYSEDFSKLKESLTEKEQSANFYAIGYNHFIELS